MIGSVNWTLAANLENLTLASSGNLNATGNSLANLLTGTTSNNILTGNDTLDGGAGTDSLAGGTGDDTCVLGWAGVMGPTPCRKTMPLPAIMTCFS